MIPFFQKELNKTQELILKHLTISLGATKEQIHYYKQQKYFSEESSVDIAIVDPTSTTDAFVVSTLGLSLLNPDQPLKTELIMILPKWWKPNHKDFEWPFALLKNIVNGIRQYHFPYTMFSTFKVDGKTFGMKPNECEGAVLVAPEILPESFFNISINDKEIFFLQLLPLTSYQVSKINEVGIEKFLQFDLHDAEGNFVYEYPCPEKPKPIKRGPIDKIIDHNEGSLLD